ncbi:hypothetical protein K0A97_01465 [Patescibacteria group bacterium]|nr:hypothetical protein [Patescibacteria group bacterium]
MKKAINLNFKQSIILILGIFVIISSLNFIKADQAEFYCAEKTINNEWCQMVPIEEVDTSYSYSRTSCEFTEYCSIGTCISVESGSCQTSPKTLCNPEQGGYFNSSEINQIEDCKKGCCILSNGARIVRKIQCTALSRHLNLVYNFIPSINTEAECSAQVASSNLGACIIETNSRRTCYHKTGGECQSSQGEFHEGFLCSNPQLGTGCLMSNRTTCVSGKNEVYFMDSCGNIANVYDFSRRASTLYWSYFPGYGNVELSTGDNLGNIRNPRHGYCDYTKGSTCARYDVLKDGLQAKPALGNYVCRNLNCRKSPLTGNLERKHGESWCSKPLEYFENAKPGDVSYLLYCYNGEVKYELCDHYRNSLCYEERTGTGANAISSAGCILNKWQECFGQDEERFCLGSDKKCSVVPTNEYPTNANTFILTEDATSKGITLSAGTEVQCIPKYPPGLKFWEAEPIIPSAVLDNLKNLELNSELSSICDISSDVCKVQYYRKSSGWLPWGTSVRCEGNNCLCIGLKDEDRIYNNDRGKQENLNNDWVIYQNDICTLTADCGGYSNTNPNPNFLDISGIFHFLEFAASSGRGGWGKVMAREGWWARRAHGTVDFTCKPWQPILGGEDCSKCNGQLFPCTEYQCRSLGKACQFIQGDSDNPLCIYIDDEDVIPPIINEREESLIEDYVYKEIHSPTSRKLGVEIEYTQSEDGCLPAFEPFSFGIELDKLGYCKFDYERTEDFDEMEFTFGNEDRNTFALNYTQTFSLPGVKHVQEEYESEETDAYEYGSLEEIEEFESIMELIRPSLHLNGEYEVYVRCKSLNNAYNIEEFMFKFCMEDQDDITPPIIRGFDWQNESPLAFFGEGETRKINVKVYINKPSQCKWSLEDKTYESMENSLNCQGEDEIFNNHLAYFCDGELTGLENNQENDFYFRCNSSFGVMNSESKRLTLIGTTPLDITSISPNVTTVKSGTSPVTVPLEVRTYAGYQNGVATCQYSSSGNPGTYSTFSNTNSQQHSTNLYLEEGSYGYHIRCYDNAGNSKTGVVSFNVETDTSPPIVIRVYREANNLKIITNEEATCVYSNVINTGCMYNFEDGQTMTRTSSNKIHSTSWDYRKIFYIKCKDEFENQPYGAGSGGCSIIIKPFEFE